MSPLLFAVHPPPLQLRPTTTIRRPRIYQNPLMSAATSPNPAILVTNDDGLDPSRALVLPLAQHLVANGHTVVVVAPGTDNSACGQRITLDRPLSLRRHPEHERHYAYPYVETQSNGGLAVFSLDVGTPSDCVIAALELLPMLGLTPRLAVSGINLGQNLGNDVLYSGTFAAARQAAMYGIPAVASSLDLFVSELEGGGYEGSVTTALEATLGIVEGALRGIADLRVDVERRNLQRLEEGKDGLRRAFGAGDCVLNLNIPQEWRGGHEMTRLDCVLYRGGTRMGGVPGGAEEVVEVRIKGAMAEYMRVKGSDVVAVLDKGVASVSAVSTWPVPHPLAVGLEMLEGGIGEGLPEWLRVGGKKLVRAD